MQEKTIESTLIYKGRIIDLRNDKIQLPDGRIYEREIVDHEPAVVILPYDEAGNVHLIKQYRTPVAQTLIECAAGIIDQGEDPLLAAKRELAEETGLRAKTWLKVGESYPTPGFCNEYFYFYLATDLEEGQQSLDEDERIERISCSLTELGEWIRNGEVIDGKTVLSYFYLKEHLEMTR